MTKVYPNASFRGRVPPCKAEMKEEVMTVWKKSLIFNCNGFTVFDGKGDLVYRVDNYMEGNKGSILLMDANGKALLTIRRKKMSLGLGDNWLVYEGEETMAIPRLSFKKSVNIFNKCLAYVTAGESDGRDNKTMYEIEGSYSRRRCAVLDDRRRIAAEIKRKEGGRGVAFGTDIFRLVVQPNNIRTDFAMALVILLDQMF